MGAQLPEERMTHAPQRTRKRSTIFSALLVALALIAAACGSDTAATEAAAIETNNGGISVKPPDILEGAPTAVPQDQLPPPVEGAKDTPIVDFAYFDGSAGSSADFAGRPTVVNFWASNCAACVAEMPEFELASQALLGEVDFVGMNVNDDSRESAVAMAEQTGVTYRLAEDVGAQFFRGVGGFVMPTTVFLNPQGQVAFVWSGVLTESELRKLIDQHIAPGSNSDV